MHSMLMLIVGPFLKTLKTFLKGAGIEERATILVVEAIVKRQKRAQRRRRGIGERVDVAETDQRRGVSRRGEGWE